jgi:hypothetical protein|eukprot:COSAG01_NODE_994_length_12252_cov_10.271044_8_plen_59_part_00
MMRCARSGESSSVGRPRTRSRLEWGDSPPSALDAAAKAAVSVKQRQLAPAARLLIDRS